MEAGMYERYWLLSRRPFNAPGECANESLAATQQALLEKLRFSLLDSNGVAAVTGFPGTGKTTLAGCLAREMRYRGGHVAWTTTSVFDASSLLRHYAQQLLPGNSSTKTSSLSPALLQDQLQERMLEQGGKYLLLVDEAQSLNEDSLALLKRLVETAAQPMLKTNPPRLQVSLLLTGHAVLRDIVRESPSGFGTLVTPFTLDTLKRDQTGPYLEQALRAAGGQQTYFDESAVDRLFRESRGNLRLLNRLADLSLLAGFVRRRASITEAEVEAALQEVALPQAA